MRADRQMWENARKWLGVVVPLVCLLTLGFLGDPQAGAKMAGTIWLVVMVVTSYKLAGLHSSYTDVIASLLTVASPSTALLTYGFTGSWLLSVAVGPTVWAIGLVGLFWHDMVVTTTVVLCWMAEWTFLLVGIFDNWRTASIWGGGVAVFAALVFAVGRRINGYGLRSVFVALACAGPPLGLVAWGISTDWKLAATVGLLPTVAGVGSLILTQDYSDEL